MGQVAENVAAMRERVDAACRRAGREPAQVRLMAVSKTQSAAAVEEAYAAGLRLFGENRVQEAVDKAEALAAYADLSWAMIGHLQTNKARDAAGFAAEFQALDSVKIAGALDRRLHDAGRQLDVFIQVNSSGEPQKFGLAPDEVEGFARDVARFSTLRVRGLMTLAVFSTDQDAVAACFVRMRTLQDELRAAGVPGSFDELSMGMSGDFELAIEYGATTVRVGEAIFGPRRSPLEDQGPAKTPTTLPT